MISLLPQTKLEETLSSTSLSSSISFGVFRLQPLELSCLSFCNSCHLFSIACSLFSQNTRGGIPPEGTNPRHRSEKSAPRRSVFGFRPSTVDCRPPSNSFPCRTYKNASRKSFACHTSEKRGVGSVMVNQQSFFSPCARCRRKGRSPHFATPYS